MQIFSLEATLKALAGPAALPLPPLSGKRPSICYQTAIRAASIERWGSAARNPRGCQAHRMR